MFIHGGIRLSSNKVGIELYNHNPFVQNKFNVKSQFSDNSLGLPANYDQTSPKSEFPFLPVNEPKIVLNQNTSYNTQLFEKFSAKAKLRLDQAVNSQVDQTGQPGGDLINTPVNDT
ncbi:hypothetical protein GCM10023220_71510 [Streptomyces ziwulingensis]|uniref:Uncharacterized protein n=1 Tax=Streptomyces ziwulingensis TaxID=1045501 RepID=A0ABP9D4H4_9ACTN